MSQSIASFENLLDGRGISICDLLSLRGELRAPFKLHPLGFWVCTLLIEESRRLRLHYWPVTEGRRQSSECQIHDHLFAFKSWVLAGAVENVEYAVSPDGKLFSVYRTEYVGDCSLLMRTDATVRLRERHRFVHEAGSSYTVSAGVLHETSRIGRDAAFTVLVTTDVTTSAPTVLGPENGEAQYQYRREPVDDETVNEVLKQFVRR